MMRMITFAGTASCGKTSVILRTAAEMQALGRKVVVVKFDCVASKDEERYRDEGIVVTTGLAGGLCPDHFFVSSVEQCWSWASDQEADVLMIESAGLCNRCSPHLRDIPAVCVVDNLSGVNTPHKIGPMLKLADVVVVTKGDVVSQAEREVFAHRVRRANPRGKILAVNGLTGQGAHGLRRVLDALPSRESLNGVKLRFTMPAALCSYCLGEKKVGTDYQIGLTDALRAPKGMR